MSTLRPYDIRLLEKDPDFGPVWVMNSSKGERRGNVVLTIARNSGIGQDAVVVPPTWVPIDLTNVVGRKQLLLDNQFRQSLAVGLLRLVHPDDAEALFQDSEEARVEQTKLSNQMMTGGLTFQHSATEADPEVFGSDHKQNIPATVTSMLMTLKRASIDKETSIEGEVDAATQAHACGRLRSMGEMDVEVYKHIYHATAKSAPSVSILAKELGKSITS